MAIKSELRIRTHRAKRAEGFSHDSNIESFAVNDLTDRKLWLLCCNTIPSWGICSQDHRRRRQHSIDHKTIKVFQERDPVAALGIVERSVVIDLRPFYRPPTTPIAHARNGKEQ